MKVNNIILFILSFILFSSCNDDIQPNEVKFNTVNNLPIIMVDINGKYARLLVDSGASVSIIDSALTKEYDFHIYKSKDDKISGIGGTINMYNTSKLNVTYRDSILKIPFKSTDFSAVRENLGVIGVVGGNWLNSNDIKIDYETKRLILSTN